MLALAEQKDIWVIKQLLTEQVHEDFVFSVYCVLQREKRCVFGVFFSNNLSTHRSLVVCIQGSVRWQNRLKTASEPV